jgi:hypothetical protein
LIIGYDIGHYFVCFRRRRSVRDQPRVQEEFDPLQQQFDMAVVEKHRLNVELSSMRE